MANIIDYIKWRGDLSFKNSPFNEVDNLILSQMIYTEFDDVISEDETVTVEEVSKRFFAKHTVEEVQKSKSFIHLAPMVLLAMASSERFKDLKMHGFQHELNEKKVIQFAAIQIDISDSVTYVAFRGTDDTLIGWREDFDMVFQELPSQKAAVDYLVNHLSWLKKYYIGGHSKGGNLVAYAGMKINPKYLKRIIHIYDNDGPGLSNEMFNEEEYQRILPKFTKIVPEFDIIGTIFDQGTKRMVVASNGVAAYQHDAMTWQVEGNKFVYKPDTNQESKVFQAAMAKFIKEVDKDQQKIFVDQLFSALDAAGIKQVTDVYKGGVGTIMAIMKSLSTLDKSAADVGHKLISSLAGGYSEELFSKFKICSKKQKTK